MKHVRLAFLSAVFILVIAQAAAADVKMRQKIKNSGFAGLGASESEGVTLLSAEKMKSTVSTRFTGGVVGFFAGKEARTQTNIVRLDKQLIWDINEKEKSYKETTFTQMRAQMEEARAKMKESEEKKEDSDTKTNVKFDVNRTGEKKTINGFACEHVILTLTVEEENLKTHEKRDISYFTMDEWLTTGQEKAQAEVEAFYSKMAKAMGTSEVQADFMATLMAQYGNNLKQLKEKAKELKGLPIFSTLTIEAPGGGKQEVKEEEKPKISLPGGIGGLFGKKEEKEEPKKEEKKEEAGKPGHTTIFSLTTEVLELGTTPVSPKEFDLPPGLEKKD